ncbi:MAG: cyclic nucleotide-binding domain-containing protein [Xanthomonadales bacterium]|nr:cyclic nucleotide-binding domain-containing protein [Xanthomonadales bacterium]
MKPEALQSNSLFQALDPEEARLVASHVSEIRIPRNSLMITEGERNYSLYMILEGKVKVFLLDEAGQEVILNYLHAGDQFGEISLFDDGHCSASVQTLTDCRFGVLEKDDFLALISAKPKVAMTLLKGVTRRLRDLSDNVRTLAANW